MEKLAEALEPHRGKPGIVYCASKEECIEVALYLHACGFNATHAIEQSEDAAVLLLYDADPVGIAVAQVGGLVKESIRTDMLLASTFVVHVSDFSAILDIDIDDLSRHEHFGIGSRYLFISLDSMTEYFTNI